AESLATLNAMPEPAAVGAVVSVGGPASEHAASVSAATSAKAENIRVRPILTSCCGFLSVGGAGGVEKRPLGARSGAEGEHRAFRLRDSYPFGTEPSHPAG